MRRVQLKPHREKEKRQKLARRARVTERKVTSTTDVPPTVSMTLEVSTVSNSNYKTETIRVGQETRRSDVSSAGQQRTALGRAKSGAPSTPDAGEDVGQREPLHAAGSAKWRRHLGRHFGSFFPQNWTYSYHMIQQPLSLVLIQRSRLLQFTQKPACGAYCSLVHNRQNLETIKMSSRGDGQTVVHPDDGLGFRAKKK